MDGSDIQDLDKSNVPSKRRNSVIADIFSRIRYMERRGSGFRKVMDAYRTSVNYTTDKEIKFVSNGTTFFVTLYNLNYKSQVSKNGKASGNVNGTTKLKDKDLAVLGALQDNGYLTIQQLVSQLNIPQRTISRILLKLRECGIIKRIGSDKTGYWEIIKNRINNRTRICERKLLTAIMGKIFNENNRKILTMRLYNDIISIGDDIWLI